MRQGIRATFAVAVHRFGYAIDHIGYLERAFVIRKALRAIYLLGRFLSVILCKITIQEETKLIGPILLSPKGNIILGAEKIGNNCLIHHNVTLGMQLGQDGATGAKPSLGDWVWIGPDTIIHGHIKVGDGATVLPGSVLTKSIPPYSVVSGNPATVAQRNYDNKLLFMSWEYQETHSFEGKTHEVR